MLEEEVRLREEKSEENIPIDEYENDTIEK